MQYVYIVRADCGYETDVVTNLVHIVLDNRGPSLCEPRRNGCLVRSKGHRIGAE